MLPVVRRSIGGIDPESFDGIDELQHALDLGPAGEPQQDDAEGRASDHSILHAAAGGQRPDLLQKIGHVGRQNGHLQDRALAGEDAALVRPPSLSGALTDEYLLQQLAALRPADSIIGQHPIRRLHQDLEIHERCGELRLDRLSRMEVERHLALRFGDDAVASALSEPVFERTQGQPGSIGSKGSRILEILRKISNLVHPVPSRKLECTWLMAGVKANGHVKPVFCICRYGDGVVNRSGDWRLRPHSKILPGKYHHQEQGATHGGSSPPARDCEQRILLRSSAYLSAERIAKAKKLKLAVTAGIGSDHVDLKAAAAHGVTVAEVTFSNSVSVSEHVVMMTLALVRNYLPSHQFAQNGGWNIADCVSHSYDVEGCGGKPGARQALLRQSTKRRWTDGRF